MTVKELIAELKNLPQDALVVLQKDAEGNGYSPCRGAESTFYEAQSSYHGECRHPDDRPEGAQDNAVVLWPVN